MCDGDETQRLDLFKCGLDEITVNPRLPHLPISEFEIAILAAIMSGVLEFQPVDKPHRVDAAISPCGGV